MTTSAPTFATKATYFVASSIAATSVIINAVPVGRLSRVAPHLVTAGAVSGVALALFVAFSSAKLFGLWGLRIKDACPKFAAVVSLMTLSYGIAFPHLYPNLYAQSFAFAFAGLNLFHLHLVYRGEQCEAFRPCF